MTNKQKMLSSILSVLFVATTISITYGNDEDLNNLEKEYPKLVKPWKDSSTLLKEIRKSDYIFGVPDRAIAEKKKKKMLVVHSSNTKKFRSQYTSCKNKMTSDLAKAEKKLASLEKKKKLTPAMEAKKDKLEEDISRLQGMIKQLTKMNDPFPVYRHVNKIRRMKIDAGEVAQKQIIASAANLVKYRMALQDNIADIKKLQKIEKSKLTSTEKQKLKKSLQQLAINYKKVVKAAETKKKPLITQISKLEKKAESIKIKTEKAEKAKRSTDKLDHERLSLIGEISTLNYQLDLIDKMVNAPEVKKFLGIK